ncbi:Prostaglandin reductase-3 [Cucurbita argyrosperma subsp. argyrosperma]|nr:Prostaglandin reductase-3 [Cucurbita argyrosperma subsp. argyrosperma]
MELKPGLSAIVTGGASGIGRALCLALGEKGVFVTVVDLSEEKGQEVASIIQQKNANLHPKLDIPPAMFIRCDVTNRNDLQKAFGKHLATYGGLDICINSAGIASKIVFHNDQTDGAQTWRRIIDVNLISVMACTQLAIKALESMKKPGVIVNLGSAAGLYPLSSDPAYTASKGGVVMFTRALSPYKRKGIRVNVLCPEFVKTELAATAVGEKFTERIGGYVPMEMVIKGTFELITDESKAGSCLWISNRRGMEYSPTPAEEAKYLLPSSSLRKNSSSTFFQKIEIPQSFDKVCVIVVHTLSHNFREATSIVRAPLRLPIKPDQVLVKIIYAGVNASDVNFSSGHYFSNSNKDLQSLLPLNAGFEVSGLTGVGIIAAVGDSVNHLKVGTPAAMMTFGSYAEFVTVHSKHILPVARPDPEVVAMLTSGLTASIALEKAAQMESGKVVLVTAAAGGTGQFAVQLAKLAGNKVVATCGGKDKATLLKQLGVDRVIDYRSEDVKTTEYPKGVDIIYESVGGDMFSLCLNALAVYGRLVVIGMISQYQGEQGWEPSNYPGICEKILKKSQTIAGFFLIQYAHLWQQHLDTLFRLFSSGKLKVSVDPKRFLGVQSVVDAVEYLHSGKSVGKVVVCIDPTFIEPKPKL